MKLKILATLVLFIGGIAFLPTLSEATPVPIGEPILGNSWSQAWQENSIYGGHYHNFDKFEAFIISDQNLTKFESTGLTNLSSGFSALLINPYYSVATGPGFNETLFYFTTVFSGNLYNNFTFDIVLWVDNEIHGAQRTIYNGGWGYTELNISQLPQYNRVPVPEPGILILLGISLASVAFARKKFKG